MDNNGSNGISGAPDTDGNKPITRHEMIHWYTQQIEVSKLRTEFAELNARAAIAETRRVEAIIGLATIQGKLDELEKSALKDGNTG